MPGSDVSDFEPLAAFRKGVTRVVADLKDSSSTSLSEVPSTPDQQAWASPPDSQESPSGEPETQPPTVRPEDALHVKICAKYLVGAFGDTGVLPDGFEAALQNELRKLVLQ